MVLLYILINIYFSISKYFVKEVFGFLHKVAQMVISELCVVFVGEYICIYDRRVKVMFDLFLHIFHRKTTYPVIWISARMGVYHISTVYVHTVYTRTLTGVGRSRVYSFTSPVFQNHLILLTHLLLYIDH